MTILVANSNSDPFNQALIDALGDMAQPIALPYGDALFVGLWENNRGVRVLVERKRTLDFIQCVLSGRHLKQAQDAANAGYDFQWLIVEGHFSSDAEGMVVLPRQGQWVRLNEIPTPTGHLPDLEFRRLDDYLNQIDLYLGIRHKITHNVQDTARRLINLYEFFQKPVEDHRTLRNAYQRAIALDTGDFLVPPTLLEKVTMQFPKVGFERGKSLAREFGTLRALCEAIVNEDEEALCAAAGVGPGIAQAIIDASKEDG